MKYFQIVGNGEKALNECTTFNGKPLEELIESCAQKNNIINEENENNSKKFILTHLRSKNMKKIQYNFIDDIFKYKKNLNIFPNHKVVE